MGRMKQQRDAEKVFYSARNLLSDLKSCAMKRDLQWGRRIHAKAVESENVSNMYVVMALIKMYAKCGSMVDARRIFDSIQKPDVVYWTPLLLGYAENGDGLTALDLFSKMEASGCVPDSVTYVAALKACTSLAVHGDGSGERRDYLARGREIHSQIGCHLDHYVQNMLVDMYSKYGSMVDARRVFNSIRKPDVVSWTALLLGYADNGDGFAALELFSRMKTRGCAPDSVAYVAALKACTSLAENGKAEGLERGREIHSEIGCHLTHYVQSTLIEMYAKSGCMAEARFVFNTIQNPNVVSWTALLMGYAENGAGLIALELFSRMKARGCSPNSVTYVAALKACTSLAANLDGSGKGDGLERGKEIHMEIGSYLDHCVKTTLIVMYAKCGSIVDARCVFDGIWRPDVVSWNALILGYADNGEGHVALELLSRMKATRGCSPNSVTYVGALKACGLIGALDLGRKFHLDIREFTPHVVTCLVDFYGKCASMAEAYEVFHLHSRVRVVPTWNALLTGYGSFGDTVSVFSLFEAMQDQGFQPDGVTFLCMISCCSHAGLVDKASEYFEAMPVQYRVIPTLMHYTCMIDVLGRANQLNQAVFLLRKMPYKPNAVTWMTLLSACRRWKNVEIGRWAFQSSVDMDKNNAHAYVLMSHIYGSSGMWEEQERVLETRIIVTNEVGKLAKFVIRTAYEKEDATVLYPEDRGDRTRTNNLRRV